MPELVSTMTKLRKFVVSQIRLAERIDTLQNASLSSTFLSSGNHDNSKSPSAMIRDFSKFSPSSAAKKAKVSSHVIETDKMNYQQQVPTDLLSVPHQENRIPAVNDFRQNEAGFFPKEEEKSLTMFESEDHVDEPVQGKRNEKGKLHPSRNPIVRRFN